LTNSLLGLAGTAKTATYWISGLVLIGTLVALGARRVRRMIGARKTDHQHGAVTGHRSSVHVDAGAPR